METKQITYLKGDTLLVFLIKPAAEFSLVLIHFLSRLDIQASSYFHELSKYVEFFVPVYLGWEAKVIILLLP